MSHLCEAAPGQEMDVHLQATFWKTSCDAVSTGFINDKWGLPSQDKSKEVGTTEKLLCQVAFRKIKIHEESEASFMSN